MPTRDFEWVVLPKGRCETLERIYQSGTWMILWTVRDLYFSLVGRFFLNKANWVGPHKVTQNFNWMQKIGFGLVAQTPFSLWKFFFFFFFRVFMWSLCRTFLRSGMFEKKPNSYNLGSQNTVDGWQVCIVLNSFQKFNDCEPYSIWILFVKSNCLRVGMSLNDVCICDCVLQMNCTLPLKSLWSVRLKL